MKSFRIFIMLMVPAVFGTQILREFVSDTGVLVLIASCVFYVLGNHIGRLQEKESHKENEKEQNK